MGRYVCSSENIEKLCQHYSWDWNLHDTCKNPCHCTLHTGHLDYKSVPADHWRTHLRHWHCNWPTLYSCSLFDLWRNKFLIVNLIKNISINLAPPVAKWFIFSALNRPSSHRCWCHMWDKPSSACCPQQLTSPGLDEKIRLDNSVSELTFLPIYPKEFSVLLKTSTCNNR